MDICVNFRTIFFLFFFLLHSQPSSGKLLIFVNIPPLECPYVSSFLDELNQMQIYYYDRGLRVLAFQSFEFGCDVRLT
jgi:glutathione peroxidase-family protein